MTIFPVDGVSGGKIIVAENRNACITIGTDQDEEPAAKNRSTNKQKMYHLRDIYTKVFCFSSDTNCYIAYRPECVVSAHRQTDT